MKKIPFHQGWEFKKTSDEQWHQVTLPHDAMLWEERKEDAPGGSAAGFFTGGKYRYRRTLELLSEWEGQYLALEFEGVYRKCRVYVNGEQAGECKNGYRRFIVELTSFLKAGENVIEVEVDNSQLPNSRWYTGSGIYRPVTLLVGEKEHIAADGLRISTVSTEPARILVEAELSEAAALSAVSSSGRQADVTEILLQIEKDGEIIAEERMEANAQETGEEEAARLRTELTIPDAKLWSEDTPELYLCRAKLLVNGQVKDETEENFGIRQLSWSPKGFFVNGKETLLRGACVHHDNGILGAATYAKSEERRVRILKEQGYNAIRSSHNPASKAMIEACDKYGMYLMDETWDMWYSHKNKYDYATDFMTDYRKDIASMVAKDFNHPSVIMYSLANEVSEPREEKGVKLLKEMVDYIHLLDDSRPATAGINLMIIEMASKGKGVYNEEGGRADEEKQKEKAKKKTEGKKAGKEGGSQKEQKSGSLFFNMMTSMIGTNMNRMANGKHADQVTSPALDTLDIAGYNYASGRYPLEGKAHPNRIVFGSETFPQDICKNWEMVKKYPYLIGDFMWTGWDYMGEAGAGVWSYEPVSGNGFEKDYPYLLAGMGAVDITGYAGAESYYAAAVWGLLQRPYIGVRPVKYAGVRPMKSTWRGTDAFDSWSWQGCEGKKAQVEIYADAAFVELYLNRQKIGKKKIKTYKAVFKVKYAPGTLTAVAFDASGKEIGRNELQSASGEKRLVLLPEEKKVKPGEIVYVPVQLQGSNGIVESNGDTTVTVSAEGGTLLGFGSAKPNPTQSYVTGVFDTWYGRALAVVRAGEKSGTIRVKAKAAGMEAETEIVSEV